MITLDEIEEDSLKEIFNLGVGYAADSLSRMVGENVRLSVPEIKLLSRAEASEDFRVVSLGSYCGVVQRFEGDFQAHAMLMFPGEKSLELVRLMVGDAVPLGDMSELEQEALTEVGNILLNSCVSVISDTLGSKFDCSMPEYVSGFWSDLLPVEENDRDYVMMLNIDFTIERREIQGYLLFIMHLESLEHFKQAIKRYLEQYL